MPISMRKLPNQELYRVYNKATKKVHAKGTTKEKATRQMRLLNMLDRKGRMTRKM